MSCVYLIILPLAWPNFVHSFSNIWPLYKPETIQEVLC